MNSSLDRARADLEAGRPWKARDRLNGILGDRQDAEVLDLLAAVHYEMHDLPAAGAIWFVTGRDDHMAQDAIAAWRERHGNDEARWRSIPSPIRSKARSQHLGALEGAAKRASAGRRSRWDAPSPYAESRWERVESIAFGAVAVWVLVMIGIGMWTVFWWIWR